MQILSDLSSESVEVLRERLNAMKRLMADKKNNSSNSNNSDSDVYSYKNNHTGIIDGNFLSLAFGGALIVIVSVSVYAFYNLYHAILKKFPSHHTEL